MNKKVTRNIYCSLPFFDIFEKDYIFAKLRDILIIIAAVAFSNYNNLYKKQINKTSLDFHKQQTYHYHLSVYLEQKAFK